MTEVLNGRAEVGQTVSFAWDAWELNPDGSQGRLRAMEGVVVPGLRQEVVLFLREMPAGQELDSLNRPTHYLATLDGILDVVDGLVRSQLLDFSDGEGEARVGIRISGLSLDDLRRSVTAGAEGESSASSDG